MPEHSNIHPKNSEFLLCASGTGTGDTVMNEEVSLVFSLTSEPVSTLIYLMRPFQGRNT